MWSNKDLLQLIVSFQHGKKYYEVTSGDLASKCGWLSFIKIRNSFLKFTRHAINLAARNGHLEVVTWLHQNRKEGCTTWAMDFAAANGHLEVLKWLYQNRKEGCTEDAMEFAKENGHFEIVKWLCQNIWLKNSI